MRGLCRLWNFLITVPIFFVSARRIPTIKLSKGSARISNHCNLFLFLSFINIKEKGLIKHHNPLIRASQNLRALPNTFIAEDQQFAGKRGDPLFERQQFRTSLLLIICNLTSRLSLWFPVCFRYAAFHRLAVSSKQIIQFGGFCLAHDPTTFFECDISLLTLSGLTRKTKIKVKTVASAPASDILLFVQHAVNSRLSARQQRSNHIFFKR